MTDGSEGCKGLEFTEEHRNKIAEKAKKRRHSEKTKQKIANSKKGQGKGHHMLALAKEKLIASRFRPVCCIETGEIFKSIAEAVRWLGVSHECIGSVCRGKNNVTHGYHWRYINEDEN